VAEYSQGRRTAARLLPKSRFSAATSAHTATTRGISASPTERYAISSFAKCSRSSTIGHVGDSCRSRFFTKPPRTWTRIPNSRATSYRRHVRRSHRARVLLERPPSTTSSCSPSSNRRPCCWSPPLFAAFELITTLVHRVRLAQRESTSRFWTVCPDGRLRRRHVLSQ